MFCDFHGFWRPKRRVREADFRRNFALYAKTVILSKYAFRLSGSTIFKVRNLEKAIENQKKIDAKCDVKNDAQKKRKKSASGSNFGALGRVRGGPGRPKGKKGGVVEDEQEMEMLQRHIRSMANPLAVAQQQAPGLRCSNCGLATPTRRPRRPRPRRPRPRRPRPRPGPRLPRGVTAYHALRAEAL